jgi:molybdopterin converting factor small subunit
MQDTGQDAAKTIHVQYYALLREEAGTTSAYYYTFAETAKALYDELRAEHGFSLASEKLKVAINNEFKSWDTELKADDQVVFIPPVAGG